MTTLIASSALAVESDQVAPGLLGFLVVAAIGLATWFLIKSMNKQLSKIDFEERDEPRQHRDEEARGGEPYSRP